MKRSAALLITGSVLAAAMALGCASDKKNDEAADAAAMQKYRILTGSTAEARAGAKNADDASAEPRLSADPRFAAGRLAETQDKLDCAAVQYEQALRLQPNHVPSLYRLGIVYTKAKQFDKAVAIWNRYIKATGDAASSYSNLGFCYEMAGDVDNAEIAYKHGLDRDANNVPCRTNYGLMLARQNRTTEAEVQLSAVLKPDEVSYNLAAVYEQQGAFAQAKEALKHALEVNPQNVEAQSKLASLPTD
jgi:Tfp pilus assembly protein PilF